MRKLALISTAVTVFLAPGCANSAGSDSVDASGPDAPNADSADAAMPDAALPDAAVPDALARVCTYIPATSTAPDILTYAFSGGSFESFGCAPIDPTYWLDGSGQSVTITFVNPESTPSIRVWGMNDDDSASVTVNGASYPLTDSTASYDAKVVCGLSPGPDGVIFSGGNLVGANDNTEGNYSYQNVTLNETDVTTMTITGLSGAGWGVAGVSVGCGSATIP